MLLSALPATVLQNLNVDQLIGMGGLFDAYDQPLTSEGLSKASAGQSSADWKPDIRRPDDQAIYPAYSFVQTISVGVRHTFCKVAFLVTARTSVSFALSIMVFYACFFNPRAILTR
jgi:hypothetical protein